jgi:pimeloyl-ACP methyl ester carboxylesterase
MTGSTAAARTIQLRDRRSLAYAEYGDPGGAPVIWFHGTPGSRLGIHPDESIARSLGVRVIVSDRPGCGLSDFKPGYSLSDVIDDVVELSEALALDRFAVAGASSGGIYAAACAHSIPHRLTCAVLVSTVAPHDSGLAKRMGGNRLFFSIARLSTRLSRLVWHWPRGLLRRYPARFMKMLMIQMTPAERDLFQRPNVQQMILDDIAEGFRQGTRGVAQDMANAARPWSFRLEDIRLPVYVLHGEADVDVPPSMGRYLAQAIQDRRAAFYPDEGHYLYLTRWKEILSLLAGVEIERN